MTTTVYHWTNEVNVEKILNTGLRKWSFVCRYPSDWRGEVCLEIELEEDIDWDDRDEFHKWQAIVPENIQPEHIKRIITDDTRYDI